MKLWEPCLHRLFQPADGRPYVTVIWKRPRLRNRLNYTESARTHELAHRFRGGLGITTQRIWLSELPEGFRGFRILQLSDIHHSLFVPLSQVEAVVELSNKLKPDLIALTGDFVTYSKASIEPVAEILGGLRARAGRGGRAGEP